MGKIYNIGLAVPAGVAIIKITDMKNFSKNTFNKKPK